MENQNIKKKRSVYVWIILVLLILGMLGSFGYLVSGLVNIKTLLTTSFLSNPIINIIRLGLYLVNLLISIIYFSKLYNFKKDVIKWTHIAFAFFIFQGFLSMVLTPGLLFALLMFIPWVIISIITTVIWITFIKHLRKLQKINNDNIAISTDNHIIDPIILKDENIDNKKEEKKSVKLLLWIKNNKKLVIILFIIIFIVIIVPAVMFLGVKIMSKTKCGDGGYLNGNLNRGYNCSYAIVNPEFTDISQCTDSKLFCNSKGKEDKNGSCLSVGVDLTTRLKVDENGGFYVEEGPVVCSYCCGGDINNKEIEDNQSEFVNNEGVEVIQAQLMDDGDMQFVKSAGLYEGILTFQNLNDLEHHTYFVCLEDLSDIKINGIYDLPSNYYLPHGGPNESMVTNGCNRELKLHDGLIEGEGKIANEVNNNLNNKENMFAVPSWRIYQSKDDGFSALFPGEPVFSHEELDYFPYNYNSYIVKIEDYIYAVDVIKDSPVKSREADSAIIELLKLFKEKNDLSDEEISVGSFLDYHGHRALTVTAGDGRYDFIGRVIYTKNFIVFYGVSKKTNNTLFNQDDAKKFLNSLNLWD